MTTSEQYRLVKVSENKPKGVITGYLLIRDGLIYNKCIYAATRETPRHVSEWSEDRCIPWFTYLERLAPFKDRTPDIDNVDLYAGDKVKDEESGIEGELSFDGYHWSIKYYDSNWESTRYYRTNPFTKLFKLGNIHEV